jgi:hypothetical protein
VQLRLEQLPQAQRHIGVFGGVFHRIVDGDRSKVIWLLPLPSKRLDRDRLWPR